MNWSVFEKNIVKGQKTNSEEKNDGWPRKQILGSRRMLTVTDEVEIAIVPSKAERSSRSV
jgi:hypothetical protein